MKRLWTATLAAAGCALAIGVTWQVVAQQPAFPTKPIRMIFGFAPGGSGDLAARLLADVATKTLGQHVVMENRTGANGMIAAEAIAKSPPDGYSVLYCTTGNMTIITELPGTKLAVNPATELMGLSQMLRSTFGLVVGKDSPWKTTKDIIDAARAKPGTVSYASPGVGSVQHLSGELLSQKTGVKMIHVPYRGSQAAIQDLASGLTGFSITNLGDTIPHIRQGTLRLIALGDPLGRQFFPDAPMIGDTVPGFETYAWFGLCGPVGLPPAVVKRWEEAVKASVEDPTVSKKLLDNGMVPAFADSATLIKTMEENRRGYREVIRAAGIKAE
ncbi:Bug family tripartite tricarboxylate transporter substrate binding protein [Reyranella sp.]|jgi:tripartite-type tricarboxylate transporter receptor subunit TctC|uniref:Bug family tripartite tricarboxylate transporter substrate binding protein n=1 Tax=Reyranella sp. TaxID=1929291 RepID=UPI003D137F4E